MDLNKKLMEDKFDTLENNGGILRPRDGGAIYITAFILWILMQVVFMLIIDIINKNNPSAISSTAGLYIINAFIQVSFVLAPFTYCMMTKKTFLPKLRLKHTIGIKQILILIAIAIVSIITFGPIANLFSMLIQLTGFDASSSSAMPSGIGNFFISLFVTALMPAVCEEILFRGFVARSFKGKSYMFGVLMSGLFFALFHGSPIQLVHQFFIGCITAYVYFITGSLYSSMLVHFTNNVIAICMQHAIYLSGNAATASLPLGAAIPIYVAAVIVGFFLLYLLMRILTRESKKRKGITVDKIKPSEYLKDLAKAFYPKGIKENWSTLNADMKMCFDDSADNVSFVVKPDDHADVTDKKLREKLIELDKSNVRKSKITDRNIIILAGVLAVIVLIFNTVANILGL